MGVEDHGILTAYIHLTYGKSGGQGAGGMSLDTYDKVKERRVGHALGSEFILRTLRAFGVSKWEDLQGRTVFALIDKNNRVAGFQPLPTEKGEEFLFEDLQVFVDGDGR